MGGKQRCVNCPGEFDGIKARKLLNYEHYSKLEEKDIPSNLDFFSKGTHTAKQLLEKAEKLGLKRSPILFQAFKHSFEQHGGTNFEEIISNLKLTVDDLHNIKAYLLDQLGVWLLYLSKIALIIYSPLDVHQFLSIGVALHAYCFALSIALRVLPVEYVKMCLYLHQILSHLANFFDHYSLMISQIKKLLRNSNKKNDKSLFRVFENMLLRKESDLELEEIKKKRRRKEQGREESQKKKEESNTAKKIQLPSFAECYNAEEIAIALLPEDNNKAFWISYEAFRHDLLKNPRYANKNLFEFRDRSIIIRKDAKLDEFLNKKKK